MGRIPPMIRTGFITVLIAAMGASAGFQEAISEPTLNLLKEATVFIRSGVGPERGSGSGFLIRKDGETGFVVTNAHVISTANSDVTFFPGTEREKTLTGAVLAQDDDWDLAVLKVDLKELPKPLDLATRPQLKETSPITIIGFPYGEVLRSGQRMPVATLTRGMISGIHRDPAGDVELIQLDGSADPGNSGGPVVDRSGALIGVLVAGVPGTKITFAIPSSKVEQALRGRIRGVLLTTEECKNRRIRAKARATLLDPFSNVKEASLLYLRLDQVKGAPKDEPVSPAAPGMKEAPLTRGEKAFEGEIVLAEESENDVVFVYQARYAMKDGTVLHTAPREYRAPFSKGEGPRKDMDDWIEGGDAKDTKGKPPEPKGPSEPAAPSKPERPATPSPRPEVTGAEVAGRRTATGDFGFRPITFTGKKLGGFDAVWSDDGQWTWVLDAEGFVRRISVSNLQEELRLATGRRRASLGKCREGLVLHAADLQPNEIWLLDPITLDVKARVPMPDGQRVIPNPAGPHVYVMLKNDDLLRGLELPSGRELFQIRGRESEAKAAAGAKRHPSVTRQAASWRAATVTPDGRYLLTSERGSLRRFGLSAGSPQLEETGPESLNEGSEFTISDDSKYVAATVYSRKQVPGLTEPGTYVFRVSDLANPVARLPSTGRFLAFDKAAGRVYMWEGAGALTAYDPNGNAVARFEGGPLQFSFALAVHREGRKGFLFSGDKNYWFDMTK